MFFNSRFIQSSLPASSMIRPLIFCPIFFPNCSLGRSDPSACVCGSEKKWHPGHTGRREVGKGLQLSSFQLPATGDSWAWADELSCCHLEGFLMFRGHGDINLHFSERLCLPLCIHPSPSLACWLFIDDPPPSLDRSSYPFLVSSDYLPHTPSVVANIKLHFSCLGTGHTFRLSYYSKAEAAFLKLLFIEYFTYVISFSSYNKPKRKQRLRGVKYHAPP